MIIEVFLWHMFSFMDDGCKLCEEMLFVKLLKTDTPGSSIFEATKSWFDESQISFGNLVTYARMVLQQCLVGRTALLFI